MIMIDHLNDWTFPLLPLDLKPFDRIFWFIHSFNNTYCLRSTEVLHTPFKWRFQIKSIASFFSCEFLVNKRLYAECCNTS